MNTPSKREVQIDVLMPTYNSVRYLDAAIRSVRNAIPNCRLIVVDRYSDDGTLEILRKHKAEVYFDDGPLGRARQILLDKSSSRTLLMYDSDVVIDEPGWYKKAAYLLGHRTEDGKPIGAVALLPNINPPEELEKFKRFWWRLLPDLERDFFVTHSTLFLKDSLRAIHIPDELGAAEDIFIWLHLRSRGYVSRTITVSGSHYFTLSEKKGGWMGANLRILHSLEGSEVLPIILRNVLFYPILAFFAAAFELDGSVLRYNLRRWIGYVRGYLFPSRYWQIERH